MQNLCILALVEELQFICKLREFFNLAGENLRVTRNAEEMIHYLKGTGIYHDRARFPFPQLLLLDCANGSGSDLEVLAWLRNSPELRDLPVLLLSPVPIPNPRKLDRHSICLDRNNPAQLLNVTFGERLARSDSRVRTPIWGY